MHTAEGAFIILLVFPPQITAYNADTRDSFVMRVKCGDKLYFLTCAHRAQCDLSYHHFTAYVLVIVHIY